MTRLQEQELRKLTKVLGQLLQEQIMTNRLLYELLSQQEEQAHDEPVYDLSGRRLPS